LIITRKSSKLPHQNVIWFFSATGQLVRKRLFENRLNRQFSNPSANNFSNLFVAFGNLFSPETRGAFDLPATKIHERVCDNSLFAERNFSDRYAIFPAASPSTFRSSSQQSLS
jgi:hypothetical protein